MCEVERKSSEGLFRVYPCWGQSKAGRDGTYSGVLHVVFVDLSSCLVDLTFDGGCHGDFTDLPLYPINSVGGYYGY